MRRSRRAEILAVTLNPPPPRLGSRTGRPGCWPGSSGSVGTPSPGSPADRLLALVREGFTLRLQSASIPAEHAHQKAAFDHAYDAVRAVGVEVFGKPSVQGRDRDEDVHQWSAWRVGEVVLAVYQAALDVMYGLSIQLDVRRSPVDAPLDPSSPFVDWMWIDP